MKNKRFINIFTVLVFIFSLASPLYSASKNKKDSNDISNVSVEKTSANDSKANDSSSAENETSDQTNSEASSVKPAEEKKSDPNNSANTEKKVSKKKSAKQIQRERNNFSGWIEPKGHSIEAVYGSLKLRIKNRIGSFNVAIVDDENKKSTAVFSTSDEYTTSGFYLKVGKKIMELNSDSSVKKSVWKTETGAAVGYRIEDLADVIVYFDVFASSQDYDVDSIKVTVKVSNMSKKKENFAVKVLLDTILGETDRHHFYDSNNNPIKNEIAFRDFDDNKWFLSKNSNGALQIIVDGGECTKPEIVALANYSTLDTGNWEADLLSYRAFDTVLSYNNSAIGITWPKHRIGADEQYTEVFYLSTALGERMPSGADFILGTQSNKSAKTDEVVSKEQDLPKEEVVTGEKKEEVSNKTEEPVSTIPPYVPFDVKTLTSQQLSPEYIQKLLNRIAALEESDDSIDREELVLLNAELDAILEALRL